MKTPEIVTSDGTVRENKKPHYRLIPWVALRRIAEAYSEGAAKYHDEVGEQNWKKTRDKQFAYECFDHAVEHLYKWVSGDRTEDHLGHAGANICFMMWFEMRGVCRPPSDDEAFGPMTVLKRVLKRKA